MHALRSARELIFYVLILYTVMDLCAGRSSLSVCILYKYEKRLLLRFIHHFKSELINNMDHMRISGTEPSSVILLSQTKHFKKLKSDAPKVSNQTWSW